MMKKFTLFRYINKENCPKFKKGDTYHYVIHRLGHYTKIKSNFIRRCLKINSSFDLIRAYIVIKAFENKKTIETNLDKSYEECHKDLPYIQINEERIYVPFFNRKINALYDKNYKDLSNEENKYLEKDFIKVALPMFTEYNFQIFNSNFIKLTKVAEENNLVAYYSDEFKTVYLITNEGALDNSIPLLGVKNKKFDEFKDSVLDLLNSYFNYDRNAFIEKLHKYNFITEKQYQKIMKVSSKRQKKLVKRLKK